MDLNDRKNSFTFLRLIFALAVVVSHSFWLGGFQNEPLSVITNGQFHLGTAAVLCFFIASGFLITASAERHSLPKFLLNRAARILPGFWAVQLLTALVLAPVLILAKHPEVEDYFVSLMVGRSSALGYLWKNALLHMNQTSIIDLFYGLPAGPAMNGSLWSLGPESMCYLYLALFALCGGLRFRLVTALLFFVTYAFHILLSIDPVSVEVASKFLHKGGIFLFHNPLFRSAYAAFVAGMFFYQFRRGLRWNWLLLAGASTALVLGNRLGVLNWVWPIALPYIVLCLAYKLPFHSVERWGDFSYGIYIYSFPIQQCLALSGLHHLGLVPFMLASIALSVGAGVLSWRWIEKPSLNWARNFQVRRREVPAPIPEPSTC